MKAPQYKNDLYRVYEAADQMIMSVAPMMDWTDRHCRYFHRQLTQCALLYTEMVVADAVIYGDRKRLLEYDDIEHPVALQLGGSDPSKLAEATRIAVDFGYDEINLNVGCPSSRVQSGTFGACLMRQPKLVADCVAAMKSVADATPITVKCRIGVDEQDPKIALNTLAHNVWESGCDGVWVHARKAWLEGLSPKENRDIPPLDYECVRQLKSDNKDKFIGLNGGLDTIEKALNEASSLDGVMMGRAAYQNPQLLVNVDAQIYGKPYQSMDWQNFIEIMADYIDRHVSNGGRANHVTRHMVGLFHGMAGARRWRQILAVESVKPNANGSVLHQAFHHICINKAA